ncbi:MAG: hypothetical protein AMXMBFR59_02250 [Rhodanobacteraceae bacterium]
MVQVSCRADVTANRLSTVAASMGALLLTAGTRGRDGEPVVYRGAGTRALARLPQIQSRGTR